MSNRSDAAFFRKVETIVLDNLTNEDFDVSSLSRLLGVSRSSLHRRLKKETGQSSSRVIRKIKLERALKMIRETKANISEIALECGFGSLSYFSVCFSEEFDFSPSELRKEIYAVPKEGKVAKGHPKNDIRNFPLPITSFIGRMKEMSDLDGLCQTNRLVSLVGSAGCGKTRLAYESVSRLDSAFRDGFWFIDLSHVLDEGYIAKEFLRTLQLKETPGTDQMTSLKNQLKDKEIFIILDNCEHLLLAVASLVEELISASSGLHMLATSREALKINEEVIYPVNPLSLIAPASISRAVQAFKSEAVLLFEDRAKMSDPRFMLVDDNAKEVAMICQRIDGIPLALELVASITRYMDTNTVLHRMSGMLSEIGERSPSATNRHRTLRSAIDWSYHLLSAEEKQLFLHLGIFAGSFSLEAAEAISSEISDESTSVLELLSNLVDRSMLFTLRKDGNSIRYKMLESFKEYARDEYEPEFMYRVSRKHFDYYHEFAEKAYASRTGDHAGWIKSLHLEYDNTHAALNWAKANEYELYQKLAGSLGWFWARSDNYTLAKSTFETILSIEGVDNETRARILSAYGYMKGLAFGFYEEGLAYQNEALKIWRNLDNIDEAALVTSEISLTHSGNADDEAGIQHAKEAYRLAQLNNNPGVLLLCMMSVSQGLVNTKRTEEARIMARKILELASKQNNLYAEFGGYHHLADCALIDDFFEEAEKYYAKGIETTLKYGEFLYTCIDISGLAMAVTGMGRYEKGLRLIAATTKLLTDVGVLSPEDLYMDFWQEALDKTIRKQRKIIGDYESSRLAEEGKNMTMEEAASYALDLKKD